MLLALGKIGTPCRFIMPARIAATDPPLPSQNSPLVHNPG
jgi:hypothetical protein